MNVTKTFLPNFSEYENILKRAWDKEWITNNGELVQELEEKLKTYLGVKHLFFCTNGTVVLQMALKAFNITKEVITTPFSYVATTNAILWEKCSPVFVDIEPETLCIDANKIEAAITEHTQAILATHVFGYACNVGQIEAIAKKHNLKVIYDGAHAFGSELEGRSLLSFGDISTCSFHATKVFQTVEGGCIICHDDEVARKLMLYRQFGHVYDDYFDIGINAKNSEFHAAMGLAVLPHMDMILNNRKMCCDNYRLLLKHENIRFLAPQIEGFKTNDSYFPIILNSEEDVLKIKAALALQNIGARRYFYPSLNELPYIIHQSCPVSEQLSRCILCLPLFHDLSEVEQQQIIGIIHQSLQQ